MRAIYSESKDFKIGHNNSLLFKSSDDMKHFRETTEGSIVIMGRKTYESIGSPLKNRFNIVLTKTPENYKDIPGTLIFRKFEDICSFITTTIRQIYVIGGVEIFQLFAHENYISSLDITTFKEICIQANKKFDITRVIDNTLVLRSERKTYKDVSILNEGVGYKYRQNTLIECDIDVLVRELYVKEQEKEKDLITIMERLNILAEEQREEIRTFSYIGTKLIDILSDFTEYLKHMDQSFTTETLREIIYLLDSDFIMFSNNNFDESTAVNYCLTGSSVIKYITEKYL